MIDNKKYTSLQLAGILIALSKACYMHAKSPNTDQLIIQSLSMIAPDSGADEKDIVDQIALARQEKDTVAPGCRTCASPCGNTQDYDFNLLEQCEEEIRQIKYDILSSLQSICFSIKDLTSDEIRADIIQLIHRGLSVISYDLPISRLQATLDDLQALKESLN